MQKVEIFSYFDNLNNKSKVDYWKNKINVFVCIDYYYLEIKQFSKR